MRAEKVHELSIQAFLAHHKLVESGATGTIPESALTPASGLPAYADLPEGHADAGLVKETVVLKLNGGLGTGMGLAKAKSLLPVKDGKTFLDYIAQQVLHFRTECKQPLRFMLMNSFSTSADTKAFFAKYPEFAGSVFDSEVELMQGKVPKIAQDTFTPAAHADAPDHEWCPPGHGELYVALASSGKLDELLAQGFKYMFVSNSDNLGATLSLELLTYFAEKDVDFLMEVCERTESDKKGGHLARAVADGKLMLRESAQCPKEDEAEFQNIAKHKYFNTNNLWINLGALKTALTAHGGVLPLPVMRNAKTVDPTAAASTKVYQLESAMGSAISFFPNAAAMVVPRSRFAPVKTCNDLLNLRSDVYTETADHRLVMVPERNGVPPVVAMEDKHYKFVDQFEAAVADGVPSLKGCSKLTVKGKVQFAHGVVLEGACAITNGAEERVTVGAGKHTGDVAL
jgi:UDP-N-acetylglucosamine pyrophosphorylase